jgi:hypothetical protein
MSILIAGPRCGGGTGTTTLAAHFGQVILWPACDSSASSVLPQMHLNLVAIQLTLITFVEASDF